MSEKKNARYSVTIIECGSAEGPPVQDMVGRVENRPCAVRWHKIKTWDSTIFLRPHNSPCLVTAEKA